MNFSSVFVLVVSAFAIQKRGKAREEKRKEENEFGKMKRSFGYAMNDTRLNIRRV
jgi:hypothetical protein